MAASVVNVMRVSTVSVDESPGAPSFVEQVVQDGAIIPTKILLPLTDHDGTPLTGLTHLNVASALVVGGVGPFDNLSAEEIKGLAPPYIVANDVTPSDAGTEKVVEVPVLVQEDGVGQDIAIWVDDDA